LQSIEAAVDGSRAVQAWVALLSNFRRPLDGLCGYSRGTAFRAAVAAAILGQVADQTIHDGKVDRVKELATLASLRNESGAL
jgi:hypothetical protein